MSDRVLLGVAIASDPQTDKQIKGQVMSPADHHAYITGKNCSHAFDGAEISAAFT